MTNFAAVPKTLKDLPHFVVWKYEERNGKTTKPPYDAKTGKPAKANDPATWTTFVTAVKAADILSGNSFDGIGLELLGTNLVGVDFDGVIDEAGNIDPYVLNILKQLGNPYAEVTPSGNGVRAFVECDALPKGGRKFSNGDHYGVEIYIGNEGGRYLTITGNKLPGGDGIPALTPEQIEIPYFLIAQFRNPKLKQLWMGDATGCDFFAEFGNDQSRTDLALCDELVKLLGKDKDKVLRYVRASKLYDEKWDRPDYIERTIGKALGMKTAKEPDDRKQEIQQSTPVVRTGTDVTRTRIKWHWKDRIALGKITLFAGNPDNGKSVVSTWIAAATTTERDFPDAPNLTPASDVLMMLGEDDIEDTAANRLVGAGADMSKIHFLEAVRLPDGQEREVALDKLLNQVEQCLDQFPRTRLIIIDPISNYLGEVSMLAEQDVRTDVLIPLKKLAAKRGVAVVIVMHLNKKGELDAIARVGGAMAFVGVARSSWLFVRDARDKNEDGTLGPKKNSFTMLGIKNNLIAAEKDGLTFKTVGKEIEVPDEGSEYVPVVEWTGTAVDSDADAALDRRRQAERDRPKRRTTQVDHAKQFLLDALQDGPKASAMLTAKAEAKGISYSSLYRAAKQELNVKMSGGDAGKQSVWELVPIIATSETVEPQQSDLIAVDTRTGLKS